MNPQKPIEENTTQAIEENIPPSSSSHSLFQNITLQQLLGGRKYRMIGDQMLFEKEGIYYLTTIDYQRKYTIAEYAELPESAPFQLIQGKLIYMPSPKDIHQKVLGDLYVQVYMHVKKNQLGEVRFAPLDVHFDKENVLQPDLLFVSVSRKEIIQDFVQGAPDLVVEILSKGTKKVDEETKMKIYGKHNVLEYWLIHPVKKWVKVFENRDCKMVEVQVLEEKGCLESKAVAGFVLEVEDLFE